MEMTLREAVEIAYTSWEEGEPVEVDVAITLCEYGYSEEILFEQFDNGETPDTVV